MSISSLSSSRSKGEKFEAVPQKKLNSDKQEKVDALAALVLKNSSKKRDREESEEAELESLKIKLPRYSRIAKEVEPPIEMQMHEAFLLGYHQNRAQRIVQIHERGILSHGDAAFVLSEAGKIGETVELRKKQKALIDDIARYQSEIVADQFKELLLLIDQKKYTHRAEGKRLIEFAQEIINQIPRTFFCRPRKTCKEIAKEMNAREAEKKSAVEESDNEGEGELGDKWLSNQASSEIVQMMREEDEKSDGENEKEVDEETKKILSDVTKSLGELLLVADHNIKGAAALIYEKSTLESNCERFSLKAKDLIQQAATRVLDKANAHESAAIQGYEETMLLAMSVEMAKLLILSSGSVNFGIADQVSELIVPEKLVDTIAVQDIRQTLSVICNSSEVLTTFKRINPPATKNINSDPAIRTLLGLSNTAKISKQDAQIFVMSGLLSHIRQAFAGTCFATCFLIKAWNEQLDLVVEDLVECTEFGEVSRVSSSELRKFPFQTRITPEYLDTLITADKQGKIAATERYIMRINTLENWPKVAPNSMLYETPSVKAICLAMNIADPKSAVLYAIQKLPTPFSMLQLIKELANGEDEKMHTSLSLRSNPQFSKEQLVTRGLYAFGSQTHHPLIRGYEQTTVIMVNYFSEPEVMSAWVYQTMDDSIKHAAKGKSATFQAMYRTLLKENFLPVISRMRYLYNHNFGDTRVLFQDGNHGIFDNSTYGYELWDTGLPKDFEYNSTLYTQVKQEASWINLHRFEKYPAKHTWKIVDSSEKFQVFAKDCIQQTAAHLSKSMDAPRRKMMAEVASTMCKAVDDPKFVTNMVHQIFGPGSSQKKKWDRNKYTMLTTPWKFRWGGDFQAVLKTFYGFKKKPTKMKVFSGSQYEVLAKCINFIKDQPKDIRDGYLNQYERIVITSPVHAFLLTPGEETFQQAWESELSATDYIKQTVLEPGLKIANRTISHKARKAMIDYVAENRWYYRCHEVDDFERLQLTESSQEHFDEYVESSKKELMSLNCEEFEKEVCKLVFQSRADDTNIGERNKYWERRFKIVFNKKVKSLVEDEEMDKPISREIAEELLSFARNHKDTNKLSEEGVEKFREAMAALPKRLSVQDFRKELVETAYKIHCAEKGLPDKHWRGTFKNFVDTTLFSLLSKADQSKIINAGIITHDSNWKVSVYDCHLMFTINPGSGKLELCKYLPDINHLSFMGQDSWFPKGKHVGWEFPNNYRVYKEEPLFNMKKLFWS